MTGKVAHSSVSPLLAVTELAWSVADKAILSEISFNINSGEFIGLLGPNGAGKSSLLRCLYRFIEPSRGQICFQGNNIWHFSQNQYAQQLAVVLQDTPNQFNLSVFDVVSLGLIPHNSYWQRTTKEQHKQIDAALEKVSLSSKRHQLFEQLSGGEKQRVMIARAIVQQPKLLVMDEPTSHLDVKYQIQIMELAKSLGITVLASFHDLNLAAAIADRLLVLAQGKLVADGTPQQVLTTDLLAKVFGVCAQVSSHPQTATPLITYFYGYQEQSNG